VYASLTAREVMLPFGLGLLYGLAQLGAGVTLYRLGLAVSGAVLNGVGVAVGTLGVSIGFAMFTITMILCSQMAAVFTGEWRMMQRSIYRSFCLGIFLLVVAVVAIGTANYYQR
jgi:hypothetical protein